MVSSATILFILVNMILGILIPVGLVLYLKTKYGIKAGPFFLGAATMLLFANILEQSFHGIFLSSDTGALIQNNLILYAIYGGLMAGLFEETGRLITMRLFMKKYHDDPHYAIMYGAGHGGIEAFTILTFGMIQYMIYVSMINSGELASNIASLDAASGAAMQEVADALISTPSWQFMMSGVERLAAVTAQVALSVIVWFAVTRRKNMYYWLAVILHVILDAAAVIINGLGAGIIVTEIAVWIIAIAIVFIARSIWQTNVPIMAEEKARAEAEAAAKAEAEAIARAEREAAAKAAEEARAAARAAERAAAARAAEERAAAAALAAENGAEGAPISAEEQTKCSTDGGNDAAIAGAAERTTPRPWMDKPVEPTERISSKGSTALSYARWRNDADEDFDEDDD